MSEIRNIIMQLASQDPTYKQGIDAMEAQVQRMPIVPEDLDDAIAMLEFVLQNPDKYGEVRASAIKDGVIDPNMVPEQYDQVFVVSLLIALYGLQDRLHEKGYARGGLVTAARRIQDAGRGGDDMLVHINHREAEMLKRMGGAGTINPTTGLHEYKSIFKIFMSVLPIALSIFAPGIGTAVGSALSFGALSGAGAAALGGAAIGAASGGITGGWKGALMGGAAGALGGGFGGQLGSSASSALGLGLGKTGQAMLGSGLIGAGVGAAGSAMTGGNVLKGAAMGAGVGAAGGAIGSMASGIGTDSALGLAANRGGQAFGNALAAGYKPKQAAISGALAGVTAGLQYQSPEQISAANQQKLDTINAENKNYSLDMGKQVNVSDISMKPSDNIVNSLKLGSMANAITPAAGGGQYVTDPVTGAETWVPNQAGAGASYDLGTTANTFGGYNYNPATMTNGNIYNTAIPGFGDAGVSALSSQNILGANNMLGSEQAIYSNAPNGQGVNALGGATGLTNTVNNPNNIYGDAATQAAGLTPSQTNQLAQAQEAGNFDWGKAALIGGGALALGSMMSAPKDAQAAVSQLSPQQQEYFNRPSIQFDWEKMQNDANQQNKSLYQYMAENWPRISSGSYNVKMAKGGPLSTVAYLAKGSGSGRADTIDAKLSDGEYVIDAETVSLLGDGSNKAGAQMLDKMRREIRAQKGKALAKGKISPDAKSPLAYLRGAM